ncbi:MAG: nuclear transport factor 2 family protein [Proteobacteria bacterium]|nr:nuclear transport factor 2 family protein [Pseudomonadota bacterium]MDA0952273.1 nuclear transport factor 2 family protein [Pseudomonadota bacterium]
MTMGDDGTAVRALAQACYDTMVAGDEAGMREVFDARAPIVGNFEGSLLWQDLDAFVAEARELVGRHGKEESRIERIEIVGDTALAVVAGRYAGLWFRDQLAMVKCAGVWRIAAKTFHVAPSA